MELAVDFVTTDSSGVLTIRGFDIIRLRQLLRMIHGSSEERGVGASPFWVEVCQQLGEQQDQLKRKGAKYYWAYSDGDDLLEGFVITPKAYFDEHGACFDGHLTEELLKDGIVLNEFTEEEEGLFTVNMPNGLAASILIAYGMEKKQEILP